MGRRGDEEGREEWKERKGCVRVSVTITHNLHVYLKAWTKHDTPNKTKTPNCMPTETHA